MNTINQTKTVEQLKQELQQAEEALRQQELQIQEREKQEKREADAAESAAKQAEINKRIQVALRPVFLAVVKAGVECQLKTRGNMDYPYVATLSKDTDINITEEYISRKRYYGHTASGRLLITVGNQCRDFPCVRYPQRKDGTFNVEKIVKTVQERIEIIANRKAEAVKVAKEKEEATTLAERLCKELETNKISGTVERGGYDHRGHYSTKIFTAPAGYVYVKVNTPLLNVVQARVLVKALSEVALLNTKKGA